MASLTKTFADFVPTKLPDEDFRAIEGASGVELNRARRKSVQRHLSRYEYDVVLRRRGVGEEILRIVEKLEKRLVDAAKLVHELEAIPGDIWPEITGRAKSTDSDLELGRLIALGQASNAILGKKKVSGDYALDLLVKNIAREFEAWGEKISVVKRNDRRESKFAKFVATALKFLPEECRSGEEAIASRWERIKENESSSSQEGRSWLGRPPRQAALAQKWYWDEN